jgi:hypothetical protein
MHSKNLKNIIGLPPEPGSLDKEDGKRCHLLLTKRLNLLPSLFVEPGSGRYGTVQSATPVLAMGHCNLMV